MKESEVRHLDHLMQLALEAGDTEKVEEYADQIALDAIWREYYDYDPVVFGEVTV